jgi:hypothetical protein
VTKLPDSIDPGCRMLRLTDTGYALDKLAWMRKERIWPNGLRYL